MTEYSVAVADVAVRGKNIQDEHSRDNLMLVQSSELLYRLCIYLIPIIVPSKIDFCNPLIGRIIVVHSIDLDQLGSFVTIFFAHVVLIWYYIERICYYTISTSGSTG